MLVLALVLVWASLGLATVTLFPVLSVLPPWCGIVLGLGFLGLQLAAGRPLLRSLLLLRSDPVPGDLPCASPSGLWIDEDRPFLFALDGAGGVVVTRGLLQELPEAVPALVEELDASVSGLTGNLLGRALALPCLLRAFHSASLQYSRFRGGSGPVWLLGEACLLLARALELPSGALRSRYLHPGGGSERSAALARLADRLVRFPEFPPWMEALGPLAVLSVPEVRALAREAWARGGPPSDPERWGDPESPEVRPAVPGSPQPPLALRRALLEGKVPPARAPWGGALRRALPGLGLGIGLLLALLPGGYLASPVLLLAAGLALRVFLQWPLGEPEAGGLRDLCGRLPADGRGLPVRLAGLLEGAPPDSAAPPGVYLRDDTGAVLLEGLRSVEDGPASVAGWLKGNPPAVLVGEVEAGGRRRRLWPYLRRLLVPLELAALGGAWFLLQAVGL